MFRLSGNPQSGLSYDGLRPKALLLHRAGARCALMLPCGRNITLDLNNTDPKQLIEGYLAEATLMQVATSKGGQPWACSVYFAFDGEFNLYWLSKRNRRHSLELEANVRVAGTVVLPHVPGQKAHALYAARFDRPADVLVAARQPGGGVHAYYVVRPSLIVLFDEVNFPSDPKREIRLL